MALPQALQYMVVSPLFRIRRLLEKSSQIKLLAKGYVLIAKGCLTPGTHLSSSSEPSPLRRCRNLWPPPPRISSPPSPASGAGHTFRRLPDSLSAAVRDRPPQPRSPARTRQPQPDIFSGCGAGRLVRVPRFRNADCRTFPRARSATPCDTVLRLELRHSCQTPAAGSPLPTAKNNYAESPD